MQFSDWELVQKCQKGDGDAFQELASRYYQKVYMVVLGMLHHREDAMEVAQDTFIRAYQKIQGFRGGSSFYTWLYRIAVNLCIDFRRRQRRSPTELGEAADEEIGRLEHGSLKDPLADLENKELRERLLSAIDDLTPDHRAVIVLRAVEGLAYKDIAEILGCSEGTVMSRLHYARKKLQQKLSPFL